MDMCMIQPIYINVSFPIQFIFMEEGATIYDVLKGFDFSAVQCALVSMDRMICSRAFIQDVRTKTISYFNRSQAPMRSMSEYWDHRWVHRIEKYIGKGFKVNVKKIAGILRSLEKDSENARRLTRLYNTGGRCVNPIKMIEITFEKCKILPSRDGIGLITKRCLKQTHLIGCA